MAEQDETGKQPGATPSAAQLETSGETTTFTQAELDAAVSKARNDALSDIGRLKKASTDSLRTAQAATERLDRMLKEQDERDLEAAQDDPERLVTIRERQKRRAAESELATLRLELGQKDERLKQADEERVGRERERAVAEVATRFGVDTSRLAKMAQYTDGSVSAIEDAAKELPRKEGKPALRPDSGSTVGGGATFTRAQIADRGFWLANKERILEAQAAGRIKE